MKKLLLLAFLFVPFVIFASAEDDSYDAVTEAAPKKVKMKIFVPTFG